MGVCLERRGLATRSQDDGAWRATAAGRAQLAVLERAGKRPPAANPRWLLSALRAATAGAWLAPSFRIGLERRGLLKANAVTHAGQRQLAQLERMRRGGKLSGVRPVLKEES